VNLNPLPCHWRKVIPFVKHERADTVYVNCAKEIALLPLRGSREAYEGSGKGYEYEERDTCNKKDINAKNQL
jgi:hypothetical protein